MLSIYSKITQHFLVTSLSLFLVSLSSQPLKAANLYLNDLNEIYVFGDSNTDLGRVFQATNETFPAPPYFKGRFSNGPVWVEYLADSLGITSNPETNFAFGGATTGSLNTISPDFPGILTQINQYTEFLNSSKKLANPNGLYIIAAAGVNDYLFAGISDPTEPVNNLATDITSLVYVGAKNIMITNIIDIGKLPVNKENPNSPNFSDMSEVHNSQLSETITQLESTLSSDLNLFYIDIYSAFNSVLANPASSGFTNVTDSCFVPESLTICNNPDQYFFWDSFHPSTAGQQAFANVALSSLEVQSTPEPRISGWLVLMASVITVLTTKKK